MKNRMKVIVFGGSGFLGSHVADVLTDNGYEVVIFDLKPSPFLKKGQEMIIGDIIDKEKVIEATSGCDYIYNFSGIADMDDSLTRPADTVWFNVIGNINIMEAVLRAKAKRFIYASTIYVYSQKGGFYRCSKQASEIYIEEYNRRFGLDFNILRYGTLYGTRADGRNSVYRFLRQALEKGCISYSGSEEATREYINVRDAARLSIDILKEKYRNQHIIVSGHNSMKFKELVLVIKEILGKDIKIEYSEKKDPDHYDYTPYSFMPKVGHKLVNHYYLDLGQGLLECLHEMTNPKKIGTIKL